MCYRQNVGDGAYIFISPVIPLADSGYAPNMTGENGPKLLADRMLGKLARLLRMVGHDVELLREGDDLAEVQTRLGPRTLLTRDKKRLGQGPLLFIESGYPFHQARQVIRALNLDLEHGFVRCLDDNGRLLPISKQEASTVPPHVQNNVDFFFRCDRCARIYWEGTHVKAMRDTIEALRDVPLVAGDEDAVDAGLDVLEPLVDLHQALDVGWVQHRLALMNGDVPRAQRTLRRFFAAMQRHIDDETTLVMPLYRAHRPAEGWERGAAPELIDTEHQRITEHLLNLDTQLEKIAMEKEAGARALACLALLDREKILGDLLEHHDLRERTFIYPALERWLTRDEKLDLVERMGALTLEKQP